VGTTNSGGSPTLTRRLPSHSRSGMPQRRGRWAWPPGPPNDLGGAGPPLDGSALQAPQKPRPDIFGGPHQLRPRGVLILPPSTGTDNECSICCSESQVGPSPWLLGARRRFTCWPLQPYGTALMGALRTAQEQRRQPPTRCLGAGGLGSAQLGRNQPTPGANGVTQIPAQLGRYGPSLGRSAETVTDPLLPGIET